MARVVSQCLAVCCLVFLFSALSEGQGAQVAISGGEILKAGENLELTVTLDKAPSFEGGALSVGFGAKEGQGSASTGGPTLPGQQVYHFQVRIPAAAPGGIWTLTSFQFFNSAAWVNLPHKDLLFRVIPTPGIVYPTSAEIQVDPSQVQLFRREALRLQTQLQTLRASVLGAGEPPTKSTLAVLRSKVEAELDSVTSTEARFYELGGKSQFGDKSQSEAAKAFFDDIRIGYSEALSELSPKKRARAEPRIMPASQKEGPTARYPFTAQAVFRLFELNELAYTLVADTQTLVFDLDVNSTPEGAAVSYRRRGDPYKQHPNPTNSRIKSLPYAEWIVRFQKDGYRDQEIDFNPFVEPNRIVSVNLQK
jgi:hypothetical protein